MKNIILLALTALMMVGCEYKTAAEIEETERLKGFNIVVIDSCEYLKRSDATGYQGYSYFAHKGNCRFCEERDSIKWEKRRKELEELIIKLK
jgi:hypothetical protein